MKKYLEVYVLYHSQLERGKEIYSKIYKELCRDANHPFEDGLDIPVYLRTGDDDNMTNILPIKVDNAERVFILLLIDDNMYCSDVWHQYIEGIVALKNAQTNKFHICCVALSKYAFDIGHGLADNQFIRLKSLSIDENWKEFQIRLYDNIIRFIKNEELHKIKIFISHSKKDNNRIGLEKAEEFRDYIRSNTKLDSFFDANDILDGQNFEEQIEKQEDGEYTLLVILNTNTYSEREWCQKEVLIAKQRKIPTVAVSLIDGEVKRSFPYISNIPYIRFNSNWDDVLALILRTALDQFCQSLYLTGLLNDPDFANLDRFRVLPFSPEAYSYVYDELRFDILYPEPPLTKDELDVLKKIAGNDKQFLTPMQLLAQTYNLNGKEIAISVSEAMDADVLGYGQAMINDLIIELSRHLLIAGGRLLYGGDLREGGFTRLFSELSLQYKNYLGNVEHDTYFFRNFFFWPKSLEITREVKLQFKNSRVDAVTVDCPEEYQGDSSKPIAPVNNENCMCWALSLQKMRREMESQAHARVIVGGKKMCFSGFMPGIMEEFMLAVEARHPVYLVGGFGGAAASLALLIKGEMKMVDVVLEARKSQRYADFYDYCDKLGNKMGYDQLEQMENTRYSCLNNGLTDEENERLLNSTDVIEIVGLILKGLKKKYGST